MQQMIKAAENHVKELLAKEGSGHDWYHIDRVRKNALSIAKEIPKADTELVELVALLHDVGDHKFHNGASKATELILDFFKVNHSSIALAQKVAAIVEAVSFKGAGVDDQMESLEGQIVQDADRLDAIGAIGIARTFAYGGSKGRLIYDPEIAVEEHTSFEAYKKSENPTIHHFYEKLLLLKDRMHTEPAKKIAQERHRFMETFLEQFYKEWNGK
tara:strand:+ start:2286 stop:2930 length:645 start_codon:yes stop_codon:yes gene_type:complete